MIVNYDNLSTSSDENEELENLEEHEVMKDRLKIKHSLFLYNSLYDERWSRNYYYQNQRVLKNVEDINTDNDNTTITIFKKKKENSHNT